MISDLTLLMERAGDTRCCDTPIAHDHMQPYLVPFHVQQN